MANTKSNYAIFSIGPCSHVPCVFSLPLRLCLPASLPPSFTFSFEIGTGSP